MAGRQSSWNQWFGSPPKKGDAKYSLTTLMRLCTQLSSVTLVTEKNKDAVVDIVRQLSEQLIWGDRNEPVCDASRACHESCNITVGLLR